MCNFMQMAMENRCGVYHRNYDLNNSMIGWFVFEINIYIQSYAELNLYEIITEVL